MNEIQTDDCDLQETYLTGYFGGNGDIYLQIIEIEEGLRKPHTVRISTSGGNFPTQIKIAAANIVRSLEKQQSNDT